MRLKFYLIGLGIGIIVTAVVMGIALRGRTREMTDEEIMARARQLGMVEASTLTELNGANNQQGTQLSASDQTASAAGAPEAQNQPGALIAGNAASSESIENSGAANSAVSGAPGEGNEAGGENSTTRGEDGGLVVEGEPDYDAPDAEEGGGAQEEGTGGEADDAGSSAGTPAQNNPSHAQNGENGAAGAESGGGNGGGPDSVGGTGQGGRGGTDSRNGTGSGGTEGGNGTGTGQGAQSGASGDVPVTGSIVVTIPDGYGSEEICELLQTAGVIDSASAFNQFLVQSGRDCYIGTGARLIPRGATYEEVGEIIAGR